MNIEDFNYPKFLAHAYDDPTTDDPEKMALTVLEADTYEGIKQKIDENDPDKEYPAVIYKRLEEE